MTTAGSGAGTFAVLQAVRRRHGRRQAENSGRRTAVLSGTSGRVFLGFRETGDSGRGRRGDAAMVVPAAQDRHSRALEDFVIGRVAALIYGLASYLVFFLSFVYTVAFIGNYWVPKSIDVGAESGLAQSILIDVVLLGAFAIQHSVMARPAFKRWWTTVIPASCERSTYVLI